MREDKLYKELKEKMFMVSSIPPQEVGPFTSFWKRFAATAKNSPIKIVTFWAVVTSLLLWFLLGTNLVRVVNILQYGF